ncbi:protein MpBHLH2 [Marchantia polymorpha subsp. ruderalis]|uniref:BHLH domain-containing protein n=1 Tax=Marchantia polymorpha TaxID=3197 RepID=A0A2R6X9G2_MARPO|nr:hypothetical protein MARPO_0028s0062 [Marchantia polymorpha]BBN00651.1 hypothetical protein Mp_2g00890 [Marchantia polymorpha subsp. ruderalis]|eukprot:PTQ42746.1 hypothetical protein MARPO_0028s0062 [Marchantia polymorpha]
MAELNTTLWDLLQTIQWSYAALWTLTPDRRMLKWQEGWFNLKAAGDSNGSDSDNKNAELFYFLYNQLTFAPGVGFAGHALQHMGDRILWLAGDMALGSIPNPVEKQSFFIKAAGIQTTICIPLEDKVLELGTINLVPENDEIAHCIKKIMYSLLDRYLKKPEPCHFPDIQFGLEMNNLTPTSSGAGPSMVIPLPNDFSSLSSKPMNLMAMNLPTVYDDLDASYIVPPVAMSAPELMQSRLSWTPEQLSMPLGHNDLDIWSTASTLAALQSHGISTSSASSTLMVDHIEQALPGFTLPMPFIESDVTLLAPSPSPPIVEATTSLRDRSSSRSSLRSGAHLEDNEISSVAKVYADCQISEPKLVAEAGRESDSRVSSGRLRRSPSPKEMSPDSLSSLPKPRAPSHGLQQPLMFHPGSTSEPSHQRPRLERQNSSTLKPADSTPVLVQLGNVLQLGNASGQVAEAPPQETDEAAVSHMLAERRRRIKQNENFSQLKALIPSATKMDKATVLAETIVYINSLKARLEALEQCNQSLKFLIGDRATDIAGPSNAPAIRLPTPPVPSSREPERVEVTPDGEGNLRIEIRSPCAQPENAIHILTSLKQMQLRVLSSQMSIDDNRITATFVVKVRQTGYGMDIALICLMIHNAKIPIQWNDSLSFTIFTRLVCVCVCVFGSTCFWYPLRIIDLDSSSLCHPYAAGRHP